MTFLTLTVAAVLSSTAAAAAPSQPTCTLPRDSSSAQRSFTNADLDRMSACRYQTGVHSEPGSDATATTGARVGSSNRQTKSQASPVTASQRSSRSQRPSDAGAEDDWRAQWRAIDQKARRLRREALELRQEAREAPRDTKKKSPTGRRSPSLLMTHAQSLENDARELEEEFQERARREGALPGWLRPKAR